jgi:hypothetical protein
MSVNKTINAAIALIEGRPEAARDILRDPSSEISNVSAVLIRLYSSIDKKVCSILKCILMNCLHLQPDESMTTEEKAAFYKGVTAVEQLLEDLVTIKGGREEE